METHFDVALPPLNQVLLTKLNFYLKENGNLNFDALPLSRTRCVFFNSNVHYFCWGWGEISSLEPRPTMQHCSYFLLNRLPWLCIQGFGIQYTKLPYLLLKLLSCQSSAEIGVNLLVKVLTILLILSFCSNRDRGVGGAGGVCAPQYFENYKDLVRKSALCPPPPILNH